MVAIVSFGDPRRLALRPRGGGESISFEMGHGDLLVMGGSCQRTWEHAVPKVAQRRATDVGAVPPARGVLSQRYCRRGRSRIQFRGLPMSGWWGEFGLVVFGVEPDFPGGVVDDAVVVAAETAPGW